MEINIVKIKKLRDKLEKFISKWDEYRKDNHNKNLPEDEVLRFFESIINDLNELGIHEPQDKKIVLLDILYEFILWILECTEHALKYPEHASNYLRAIEILFSNQPDDQ